MSLFAPVIRVVHLDDENSVTLRKLTAGQRQRSVSLATRTVVDALGAGQLTIDGALLRMEQVKLSIERWDGPEFDGRPVTSANIELLPPEVFDQLAAANDALNAGLTADEKKTSSSPMSAP